MLLVIKPSPLTEKSNIKMKPQRAEIIKDSTDKKTASKQAIDPIAFGHALSQATERAIPIIQRYMESHSKEDALKAMEPIVALQERMSTFMAVLMSNPKKLAELQFSYMQQWGNLWQNTLQKMAGEKAEDLYKPTMGDRRFNSPEWSENLLFDFIKQSYLMTSDWMTNVVHSTEGLDKGTKEQMEFYTRQLSNAMSPTNFVLTNPDVLRETIKTGGENLVKGLENLIDDLERGQGALKIRTTNDKAFELGNNLAATKGSVVFENDLIQLIQYAPTTESVFKTPVMVVPPWINKYYILDMRPDNSLAKWMVDQGHTVFMVSWVNPDSNHADKDFADYMRQGILEPLAHIQKITGEKQTNVMAYCIAGTLLAITLAWLKAQNKESPIASITFLTTLIDFENAGELKLFTDEKQIFSMEKEMKEKGVLNGNHLHKTFAMLRANDMIWSFVINNYLMGREPFPFDLLYWNEDSTNMPAAIHSFYLRKMYLENKLIEPDGIEIEGVKIDIQTIDTPSYFLSAREDHIAPWKATYAGYHAFTGIKKFVLSASGHVAGVVNPPASNKYCFWTSDTKTPSPDKWLDGAKVTKGSWWTDWNEWVQKFSTENVKARAIKGEIEPAPGRYVKKKI